MCPDRGSRVAAGPLGIGYGQLQVGISDAAASTACTTHDDCDDLGDFCNTTRGVCRSGTVSRNNATWQFGAAFEGVVAGSVALDTLLLGTVRNNADYQFVGWLDDVAFFNLYRDTTVAP